MCVDLYGDADNAARVDDVAREDRRRRALRSGARPDRRGVSVITCYPDPERTLGNLIAHLGRERDLFWRQNLDLDVVVVSPAGQGEGTAGAPCRDLPPWVKLATAGHSIHAAVNAAARDLSSGDALLLVGTPLAAGGGESPVLQLYSHLTASSTHGIVAPVLHRAGAQFDPGLRFVHGKDHEGCGFERVEANAMPKGRADPIDATASSCLMIRWDAFVDVGGLDDEFPPELARVALCVAADRFGYRTHRLNAGLLHAIDAPMSCAERLDVLDTPRFACRWGSYVECRFP